MIPRSLKSINLIMPHRRSSGSISMKRVKFSTNQEYEFLQNLTLVQDAFKKLKISRTVPIARLVKGKFQDNLEFVQWFKKFFDANYKEREYSPITARFGHDLGDVPTIAQTPPSKTPFTNRSDFMFFDITYSTKARHSNNNYSGACR